MKRNLSEHTIEYSVRDKNKVLKCLIMVMAILVVFVTTYALILPAITMERDAICGIPEHTHTDECYADGQTCELEEHVHSDDCFPSDEVTDSDTGDDVDAKDAEVTSQEDEAVETSADQEEQADDEKVVDQVTEPTEPTDKSSKKLSASRTLAGASLQSGYGYYTVWFDGTNGTSSDGNSYYKGATNTKVKAEWSNGFRVTTPTSAGTTAKYGYKLRGWYDVTNNRYYRLGEQVTISRDTVFYADWISSDYNAPSTDNIANLNTNEFIKTDVFDYNDLFNMHSVTGTKSVDDNGHSEAWKLVAGGTAQTGQESQNFVFFDTQHKKAENILCVSERNTRNGNRQTNDGAAYYDGTITEEITEGIGGSILLNNLFSTDSDMLGKYHVGSDSYLYQYDSNSGYYYYDSTKNAAAYNQNNGRFYVYPYRVMTEKSAKDDENKSDFLPYNYGTAGQSFSDTNGSTNYWFGMKSQISFHLPNESGVKDESGKYGNQSDYGTDMIFKFAGDDDVWVFVDDELILDLGGVHDIVYGEINFATGKIKTGHDGAKIDTSQVGGIGVTGDTGVTTTTKNFSAGDHKITVYYLERGASQSNCAVYFNVAPRYGMNLYKKDKDTKKTLSGAVFSIFTDEGCTEPATLYDSKSAYEKDKTGNAKNTFMVGSDGKLYCWGLEGGHTYYIKEVEPPDGYKYCEKDIIKLSLNNDGSVSQSVISGYSDFITDFERDTKTHTISFTVLNEENREKTTEIEVDKKWFDLEGNDVTDSVKEEEIQFYLDKHITRYSPPSDTVTVKWVVKDAYSSGTTNQIATQEVPKGATVRLKLNYKKNISWDLREKLTPTIEIDGKTVGYTESNGFITVNSDYTIDSDLTVALKGCSNVWILFTYVPSSECEVLKLPPTEESDSDSDVERMGPYTISADNGWKWSSDNLPLYITDNRGNKLESYTYSVEEVKIEYYKTEYKNNDGITHGRIVIKNTELQRPEYVLPKTGGTGNLPYTMGGLLMMMLATCVYIRIRAKEE